LAAGGASARLPAVAELNAVEARTLLARSFAEDPLMRWFFPADDLRPHACAAMFGLFAEHYLAAGRVDALRRGNPVAVAMWQWPGQQEGEPVPERLPTMDGLMSALIGPGRAAEIRGAMAVLADVRPTEPHAYLHLLAVDPCCRGEGLGGSLLDEGIAAARTAGLLACLDTMNPANVPFYEAHGLAVRSVIPLTGGGPTVWSMATA
jgi:ribosomal protein S18 acetylase RimI-like enzyme